MLPEICLSVRASTDGSAEPWPRSALEETRVMLAETLRTWQPDRGDTIDAGVNLMCRGACDVIDVELARRERDGWDY